MADKYPETSRDDLRPSANSWPDKKRGESFDHAANEPNDPRKPIDFNKFPYNANDKYEADK